MPPDKPNFQNIPDDMETKFEKQIQAIVDAMKNSLQYEGYELFSFPITEVSFPIQQDPSYNVQAHTFPGLSEAVTWTLEDAEEPSRFWMTSGMVDARHVFEARMMLADPSKRIKIYTPEDVAKIELMIREDKLQ